MSKKGSHLGNLMVFMGSTDGLIHGIGVTEYYKDGVAEKDWILWIPNKKNKKTGGAITENDYRLMR